MRRHRNKHTELKTYPPQRYETSKIAVKYRLTIDKDTVVNHWNFSLPVDKIIEFVCFSSTLFLPFSVLKVVRMEHINRITRNINVSHSKDKNNI